MILDDDSADEAIAEVQAVLTGMAAHTRAPAPSVSWWTLHPTREGFTAAGDRATLHSRHRREATVYVRRVEGW